MARLLVISPPLLCSPDKLFCYIPFIKPIMAPNGFLLFFPDFRAFLPLLPTLQRFEQVFCTKIRPLPGFRFSLHAEEILFAVCHSLILACLAHTVAVDDSWGSRLQVHCWFYTCSGLIVPNSQAYGKSARVREFCCQWTILRGKLYPLVRKNSGVAPVVQTHGVDANYFFVFGL